MSDDEYIAAYIAKNCSTEPCEFYSHGVNGLRIGRNGGLASALDQMDAFLRNRLKCSLAVKQRRHGAVPWHLAADAASNWSPDTFHSARIQNAESAITSIKCAQRVSATPKQRMDCAGLR